MLSKTKLYRGQHGKCGCFFIECLIKSLPSNRNKYSHFALAMWSFSLQPLEPTSTLGERWLSMVPPATLGGGQAQILATTLKACLWLCYRHLLFSFAPKISFWLALRYRSTWAEIQHFLKPGFLVGSLPSLFWKTVLFLLGLKKSMERVMLSLRYRLKREFNWSTLCSFGFVGCESLVHVLMSHGTRVTALPRGHSPIARWMWKYIVIKKTTTTTTK